MPIFLGERCCLPWRTENLAGSRPTRTLASTSLLQGIGIRCVLLSEVFLDQLPWFKLFRGYKKDYRTVSAVAKKWWNDLETEQPILRCDEYLPAGGKLIPSVLSQQAHMVPCCRCLRKKRLFSSGCLQFIYKARRTCCTTVGRLRKADVSSRFAPRKCHDALTKFPDPWVPATVTERLTWGQ